MNLFKYVWGMLFRLFPCPTRIGLQRIGNPGRNSPVLVTCNFYITVRRLLRKLRGLDAWLLIADSKGVNVWCAAGGNEFDTRSVVSVVKTSGIGDLVEHRRLILPPLGAPGIQANEVEQQTGWSVKWGPIRIKDIPDYLKNGQHRNENMKRVTYDWLERLDTAMGSLFPFFLLGAIGFLIFGPNLLMEYLVVGAATFVFFMLTCPWLPGNRGLTKVIFVEVILLGILIANLMVNPQNRFLTQTHIIMAMIMLFVYGSELGGLASTMSSDFDAYLSRLGIKSIGNAFFAGTLRTALLTGHRVLTYYQDTCNGCRSCIEVCPMGCWGLNENKRAQFINKDHCTACCACLVQCQVEAIKAEPKFNPDKKDKERVAHESLDKR